MIPLRAYPRRYTGLMSVPSTTTLRVRYAETDQMGVVYYANYLIWCELGRVEFLRQLGFDYKSMEAEDGCMLPVVEANCRYKSPARYDDLIRIETRVTGLRQHVIKFGYRILRAESGELLAEAETVHVVVDAAMRKQPMPEKYAQAIRATMTQVVPQSALS
ncbi:thioesterase family protein [Acidobacterium capsulatum ATCC 51196]|uniref:Thioesterase family protein n=2 Tax=Acidobacteriaceae TaxID=204434 RepID=C1F3P5_ACIC5|nr:thioesterase family protein [Acidobacterium capsulatum ATCC 51196]